MPCRSGAVVLLNTENQPLGYVDFPHAVRMMIRKVVVVVEGDETRGSGRTRGPRCCG